MTERQNIESQLALAEATYQTAKTYLDHEAAQRCAENMAKLNRQLWLLDEAERRLREEGAVV